MKKFFDSFFDENTKFFFWSSVIVMLLAHGFCFTNLMYSHDSLLFVDNGGYVKVTQGRWLHLLFVRARSFSTPWFMGIFSILYVSLAVVLVARLFSLTKLQGMCTAILFASNVTLTSTFCTYINDADADCFAILLACLVVYGFKKFPGVLKYIIPIISLILCLALYQPQICISIGLFLIVLICEASESTTWKDILNVCFTAVKELLILLSGTALYILLMLAVSRYYGEQLSDAYNGPQKLTALTLKDVIYAVPGSYQYFKDTFFNINEYNTSAIVLINWVMLCLLVISVVVYVYCHKYFLGSLVIVVPCLLIMPMALNAIYLISFGVVHQLMIYAFILAYLLPLIICNRSLGEQLDNISIHKVINYLGRIVFTVSVVAIVLIGFNNVVYANGAYVYKKLVYDNTALHAQTIWKDINSIEGYSEGETPVVFMGYFPYSKAAYESPVGSRFQTDLTGATNSAVTYDLSSRKYFRDILGRRMNSQYNDPELSENAEYIEMPAYPVNGYCKMIDGRVVVKLED